MREGKLRTINRRASPDRATSELSEAARAIESRALSNLFHQLVRAARILLVQSEFHSHFLKRHSIHQMAIDFL